MYFIRHILDGAFCMNFSISVTVDLLSKEHWKENMKLLLSFFCSFDVDLSEEMKQMCKFPIEFTFITTTFQIFKRAKILITSI